MLGLTPPPGSPLNPPCSLCPGRFWFRLYWFPLKVLYATCYSSLQSVPNIPFYFFFNALLLILTLMNIYWFLVSRGSSATPALPSPSSAARARPLLPARLWGRLGGCRDGGGLGGPRGGGGGGKPLSVPGGLLCAGIQTGTPGIPGEGAVAAVGAGWNSIGV